jgi:hypothetical protein
LHDRLATSQDREDRAEQRNICNFLLTDGYSRRRADGSAPIHRRGQTDPSEFPNESTGGHPPLNRPMPDSSVAGQDGTLGIAGVTLGDNLAGNASVANRRRATSDDTGRVLS